MGTGQLIRLCSTMLKGVFKIFMVGFRQGWGYLALGLLATVSLLNQYQGASLVESIFAWVFTPIGLILTIVKVMQNKGMKFKQKKEVQKKKLSNTTTAIILTVLTAFLGYGLHTTSGELGNARYLILIGPILSIFYVLGRGEKPSSKTATLSTLPIESIDPHGVVFGKKGSYYIVKPEDLDGHVLVAGGVGSGKSSCIAIPTIHGWNESVFAIDIKGELYEKSKENRPNIKVFNPLDENSYGYDPFFCLHTSYNPAQEARAIAQAIVPLPHEVKDLLWIESAQNIFTAAILHYSAQNLTFLDTIRQIQSTTPKTLIQELCDSPELEARYCVNSLADMEDRTLSSIMAELSKNIVLFVTDKNLISALSRKNNITPDDLEFGNDVYINIPEHLLRQWKTLLTLIVNQFLTHFEQRTEANARPILFLLDEFPRFGKVGAMLDGLATLEDVYQSTSNSVLAVADLPS